MTSRIGSLMFHLLDLSNSIFSLNFVTAKILVATGSPSSNGKHSEVISLRTNNDPWTYPDPPYDMYGGTGGFINGSALVCGGFVNNGKYNKCSFLGDTTSSIVMKYERVYTSSLVLRDKVSILQMHQISIYQKPFANYSPHFFISIQQTLGKCENGICRLVMN